MSGCGPQLALTPDQPVEVVVGWLRSYGIERSAVIAPVLGAGPGLVWQESYRAPVELAMPGDVLCAHDLGGTSGKRTVINHGPGDRPS